MSRLLYDFPFFFVFTGILAFALYKESLSIFWLFLIVSLLSILRFRVFILCAVFVAAIYFLSANHKPDIGKTKGAFKGTVYDIRNSSHLTFYVKTKNAKMLIFAPKVYDNINLYDKITFKAKLTSNIKNPAFRKYLHSKDIYLIGFAGCIKKIGYTTNIFSFMERIRQKTEKEFYYFLHNKEYLFLQNAVFGDSKNKAGIKNMFINTQTAHIMSVSGLHMGFVFGLFYALFYFIFSRIGFIYKRFSIKTGASLFAVLPTLIYFTLSGMHIPAIRSFLMVLIFVLALIYGRIKNSYNVLFFIASVMVLLFGYSTVFNPSFVMSFFMSFVAIYLYSFIQKNLNTPKLLAYTTFSVLIGIFAMPISAFYFHKIAYLSFISNFIVVPYFGFVVMPASFTAMLVSFLPIFFIKYAVFYVVNFATFLLLKTVELFSFIKPLNVSLNLLTVLILYAVMFLLIEAYKRGYPKTISTSSR